MNDAILEIQNDYRDISNFMSLKENKRLNDCWNLDKLNTYERAEKLGLEEEYRNFYKEACLISHPSSSFENYMKKGLNDLLYQLMIRMEFCIIFSTRAIYEINRIYDTNLNYAELTKITQEIHRIIPQ